MQASESSEVHEDSLTEDSRQGDPNTGSSNSKDSTGGADISADSNLQATPTDANSANAKPGEDNPKRASGIRDDTDGQDSSLESPVDHPMGNDVESADDRECDQSDQILTGTASVTPVCDNSGNSPFDVPIDTPSEIDSQSERTASPRNTTLSNTEVSSTSHPGSTGLPSKPTEKAEAPGANTRYENSISLDQEREKKKLEPTAPRRIGGRRSGPSKSRSPVKDEARGEPTYTPRPELICRQVSGSWEVVLSANDECNIAEVWDDGKSLDMGKGECRLSSLRGQLSIKYSNREPEELRLFNDTPLIFKLRNDWQGDGRKVRGISNGNFIVIAPGEWKRIGSSRVEPEGCAVTGFMAHFFYAKKGESAEDIGGFEEYDLALTKSGFELSGEAVFDDSEDGELFVGNPPTLRPASGTVWARVGEEKGGWNGENFKPAELSLGEVLNGRQGRFFVRVYDGRGLLDSGEFRYFEGLREILVDGRGYTETTLLVPTSKGHSETMLQFVGADGATIHPILTPDGTHATVHPEGILTVAPHPGGDRIVCALKSGAGSVDTVIKLPYIWWRIQQDDEESREWRDTPFEMTRQEFRDYANAGTEILLRLPPRIASVRTGFDKKLDRVYRPNERDEATRIPLADFVDYSQIDDEPYEETSLNFQCGKAVVAFIRLSADPIPEIISFTPEPAMVTVGEPVTLCWVTRNAESNGVSISPEIGLVESSGSMAVTPAEPMTYTLRLTSSGMEDATQAVTVILHPREQPEGDRFVCVKRTGGGWRQGKGFSRGELHAAGLTDTDAARRLIPIDMRRRSVHRANIDTIRRLFDA